MSAIAGCNSKSSGGSSSPSESEPGTTPTETASIESITFPAGWSADGVQDVEDARQQHKSSIEDRSFRQRAVIDTNQSYNYRATFELEYDANNRRLLLTGEANYRGDDRTGTRRADVYVNEEHLYKRIQASDTSQYSYSQSDPDFTQAWRGATGALIRSLAIYNLTAREANAVQNGVEIVYDVSGLSSEGQETRFSRDIYGDRQGGRVTITESGRVDSYAVNVGDKDETESWLESSIDHPAIGDISVSRPGWVGNV
jgi:hypothetical protein